MKPTRTDIEIRTKRWNGDVPAFGDEESDGIIEGRVWVNGQEVAVVGPVRVTVGHSEFGTVELTLAPSSLRMEHLEETGRL